MTEPGIVRDECALTLLHEAINALEPMSLERAGAIVAAINARALAVDGIAPMDRLLTSLESVSLDDMLRAKQRLEHANAEANLRRNRANARGERISTTFYVVPDDRLIAAVYTLENYESRRAKPIAIVKRDYGIDAVNVYVTS